MASVLVGAGGSVHSQWGRAAAAAGSDALPGSGVGSRSGAGPRHGGLGALQRPEPGPGAPPQVQPRLPGPSGGPGQGCLGGSEGALTGAAGVTESPGEEIGHGGLGTRGGGSRGSENPGAPGGPSRMRSSPEKGSPRCRGGVPSAPCPPDSLVVCRAAQYACALAGAALSRAGNSSGSSSGTLSRLQHLEAHLSLGRKREWRGV